MLGPDSRAGCERMSVSPHTVVDRGYVPSVPAGVWQSPGTRLRLPRDAEQELLNSDGTVLGSRFPAAPGLPGRPTPSALVAALSYLPAGHQGGARDGEEVGVGERASTGNARDVPVSRLPPPGLLPCRFSLRC